MQCFPLNRRLTEHKRTTRPHYPQQALVGVLEVSRRLTWSYCFKQDRDLTSVKELKNLRVWRNLACSLTTRDNCAIVTGNDLTSTGKFGQLLEARLANKNCRPLNKAKQNPRQALNYSLLFWFFSGGMAALTHNHQNTFQSLTVNEHHDWQPLAASGAVLMEFKA